MPRPFAIAAFCLLALGGCASMSKSQCLANDWETVGYRDGLSGTQSSALMQHQNACMKHDVVPDRQAYLAGWREGVEQYCQPANGFAAGERGAGFSNVCPAHLQGSFHAAYRDGRQLYLAQSEINSLVSAINQREQRLREVKSELAGIAGGMLDGETTTADRAAMLLTAKDLAQEQGRLESEIDDLQAEVAVKSERLEHLRHSLAFAD
jgi:DNA repair exonuclease SbcCD ATPase subunit